MKTEPSLLNESVKRRTNWLQQSFLPWVLIPVISVERWKLTCSHWLRLFFRDDHESGPPGLLFSLALDGMVRPSHWPEAVICSSLIFLFSIPRVSLHLPVWTKKFVWTLDSWRYVYYYMRSFFNASVKFLCPKIKQ